MSPGTSAKSSRTAAQKSTLVSIRRGVALGQLGDRGLLELDGHLVARGAEPLAGVAQDRGARVVRPVDPVPEAHQAFLAVERLAHVPAGVAHPLDALDHRLGAAWGPRRERPRQGADRPREGHAATSAPVEAMTRAVNVEAFMPCSAAEMKY